MGRWGDGEMGGWGMGDGGMVEDGTFFYTELNGFDMRTEDRNSGTRIGEKG
ncbi:hypothetical protein [Okeania sp. KiyG1]|uniref:hypothetical protein n=1 Tax=Okeania sp. KiyG1 TaxID=2720165 RepID=UPI001921F23E|nr:hypothetical protein [Okeania sp. KiyG1]GGA31624.1 hypothetical protein CYANOKiyG1_48350 [Okeania sp. KiyG1]